MLWTSRTMFFSSSSSVAEGSLIPTSTWNAAAAAASHIPEHQPDMHPLQAKLADIAYKTIAATCAGVTVYGP